MLRVSRISREAFFLLHVNYASGRTRERPEMKSGEGLDKSKIDYGRSTLRAYFFFLPLARFTFFFFDAF